MLLIYIFQRFFWGFEGMPGTQSWIDWLWVCSLCRAPRASRHARRSPAYLPFIVGLLSLKGAPAHKGALPCSRPRFVRRLLHVRSLRAPIALPSCGLGTRRSRLLLRFLFLPATPPPHWLGLAGAEARVVPLCCRCVAATVVWPPWRGPSTRSCYWLSPVRPAADFGPEFGDVRCWGGFGVPKASCGEKRACAWEQQV